MKQHIKKLSILFLLATLLASCDAEEMYLKESKSNNGEPVIKTLSYKEAGETFNRLKNELKIEKHLKIPETSNLQARTIKDTLGFLIETDLIKQVTLGEYKSYTMKLVKEIEGNIFFNLTIEDKNGESSMFMTCYIPSSYWVNNKDEAFQGVIVSRRMNTLTEYQEPEIFFNDIISSSINHDFGTSPGGGGSYSLQNGSPYYPLDCNGYVIVSIKLVPYPCGCENHMPWECNSCPNSPAGYDEIPYYYCQEYPNLSGDNPDNPTNPSTGGPSSPTNPNDTSIAAMIKPEECVERIVGDLNRDCQLSAYEGCLLNGNSQEVCDCVAAGGNIKTCVSEIIEEQIDDSQLDPCAKGVFQQIKNTTNNDFAKVLAKLGADGSVYNTTMISAVAPSGRPAQTVKNSPFNYTIYISTDYVGKTKLFIAASMLHELVHAYFMSLFDVYYNGNPPNPNAYNDFAILFQKFVDKTYPGSNDVAHHQQMATDYVDAIASALQEYQPGLPQQVYEDLAWGGLEEAPIFSTLFPLGSSERNRIINRYYSESQGNSYGYNSPPVQTPLGQPCN